jgi:hypothetical protein
MRSFTFWKWLASAADVARALLSPSRAALAFVTVFTLGFSGVYLDTPGGVSGVAAWAGTSDVRLEAEKPKKRLVVGIDLSQSNPIVDDAQFARKLADRVTDMIAAMGFASEVHVRTFGSYETSANNFHYDAVLSIHQRPEMVAAEVAKLISSTPALVEKGVWRAQAKTNILAFLDNAGQSFGCSGVPTTIVLLSDGIEDSEYARLAQPNAELPAPEGTPFKGCSELQILGLGQGQESPEKTRQLRVTWTRWAQAAGFASFVGLNDW